MRIEPHVLQSTTDRLSHRVSLVLSGWEPCWTSNWSRDSWSQQEISSVQTESVTCPSTWKAIHLLWVTYSWYFDLGSLPWDNIASCEGQQDIHDRGAKTDVDLIIEEHVDGCYVGSNNGAQDDRMESVQKVLENMFQKALKKAYPDLSEKPIVLPTKEAKFGDYQFNNAMKLFAMLKGKVTLLHCLLFLHLEAVYVV